LSFARFVAAETEKLQRLSAGDDVRRDLEIRDSIGDHFDLRARHACIKTSSPSRWSDEKIGQLKSRLDLRDLLHQLDGNACFVQIPDGATTGGARGANHWPTGERVRNDDVEIGANAFELFALFVTEESRIENCLDSGSVQQIRNRSGFRRGDDGSFPLFA
jgi:hypothetical protein